MDRVLASDLTRRMDEFDLRLSGDVDLTDIQEGRTVPSMLTRDKVHAQYRVGYARSLTGSALEWARRDLATGDQLLMLGPRVTERSAELFRALGVNYLDRQGNAYVTFDDVYIDVRGRRGGGQANSDLSSPRLSRGGTNLFSPKRAQVIFAIIRWPELVGAPLRQIAEVAGVSIGLAQETIRLLREFDYLGVHGDLSDGRREQLLDHWVAAYPAGLGASSGERRYAGPVGDLHDVPTPLWVSGEAAVPSLLRPETAVLYSEEPPIELMRVQRWRRDDSNPNIYLRHKFWNTPWEAEGPGLRKAPWPLVYADLMSSGDGRQREAAQLLRETQR